ncbi:MAG: carboxypeptidase regulatory-like domain-containing protein [Candidatus Cloacimonetes bacterium]|nr:carboxypeptidase regulatory-like domain-containing protein [Candidatus Cloacimonadota bacterium]
MKKLTLFTVFLLLAAFVLADVYTIGTGTTASYTLPFNGLYNYSWSKVIYTRAEINAAGLNQAASFNGIGFYVGNTPNDYTMLDQRVYFRHTTASMYDVGEDNHPNFNEFQLLFQGNLTYDGGGWYYIVLSEPLDWDGNQNIEFLFENWDGAWVSGYPTFNYTSTSPEYMAVYKPLDANFPSGVVGTRTYNRPNIQFVTPTTTPPDAAVVVAPADGATHVSLQPELRWMYGNVWPDGYRLNLGTNNPPSNIMNGVDVGNVTSHTLTTPLEIETTYYWQIVPYNDFGEATNCPVWSFTTHPAGFVTIGDGSQNARYPMDFFYKNSLYQCLYYENELSFVSGTITSLQLYNNFSTDRPNGAVKIWLGSTTQQDLQNGFISANELTLVYDGTLELPVGQNQILIPLDTPYMHTPGNLVLMVQRPMDTQYYSSLDYFQCQTVGTNRARYAMSDSESYNPATPPTGTLSGQFPKISISYSDDPILNDLSCYNLTGNQTPTVGVAANYTVNIKNNGQNAQSNYQVKLMQEGGGELLSVNGPTIQSLQTLAVNISWTPAQQGPITIYAMVVLNGDEIDTNNETNRLDVMVQPEGVQVTTIGDGNETARYPMDFWWKNSLYECIYMEDELGFVSGTITAIQLYNQFVTNNPNGATKIWLGSTDLQDLSGGYIPASQLSLVFDGNVTYPSGQNEILIPLQVPYIHTPGNLVMMVQRPMDGQYYSSSDFFKCQTIGSNRARYAYSDSESYNPNSPPAGTLIGQFPKTSFFYSGEAIENDLSCFALAGNTTPTVGIATNYTVNIKNNGVNTQTDYQIKLMQEGGGELLSVDGPTIETLQTLSVNLTWTPTTPGPLTIYATVVLTGDEFAQNNETNRLDITVQPEGVQVTVIGDGSQNARIPMDYYYKSSLYQCLYYEDELNFISGTITSLQLYNNFATNNPNGAAKIWLGSTTLQDLSSGYIPATEMTLVFDGNLQLPSGENDIMIPLQSPYMHTPGNLVMMIQRPLDAVYYSSSDYFKCQTIGTNRARNTYSDSVEYDPNSPPAGTLSGQFPKIAIFYSGEPIDNDLGISGLTGNTTPTAGAASVYTVNIKNNGLNAQDDYLVKLFTQGDIEVASVPGPAINSLQTLQVTLNWTPTTDGNTYIYATVVMDDDEIEQNNRTANFNVYVNPAGVFTFTVGDGSQNARMPIDTYYRHSMYQTLYYPDELNGFLGQITGLQLYNNFNTGVMNASVKMWLGTTTQTSLDTGYITADQLTLVFDGNLDLPSGTNDIMVPFNDHYLYLNGENLVLMVKYDDADWYTSTNYFKSQTVGSNRARNAYSDSEDYNPLAPPAGTLSGQFPKTTFFVIPGGVGHINGVVRGVGNQPLGGVNVTLNQGLYSATTNTAGEFSLINVLPDDYTLTCSVHGYTDHTQTISLEEDQTLELQITMELLPQVVVSGTIHASDTGAGIPGAAIYLFGYEDYMTNTTATGAFSFAAVYAGHTYEYNISAAGYTSQNGNITVGSSNYDMGDITLNEVAYAPVGVLAAANATNSSVDITWYAPDPNALEITEGFEGNTFPPADWGNTVTNTGTANAQGVYPTWCRVGLVSADTNVVPTEGSFQAGLQWDYNHQDEWLITPSFNCPPSAYLKFDTYVFLGSTNEDHYKVNISNDNGSTWTTLWDASEQQGGWNHYYFPITVDLSAYSGQQIKLAFQAVDGPDDSGLWYVWFIDNVYIGNIITTISFNADEMRSVSYGDSAQSAWSTAMPMRAISRDRELGSPRTEPSHAMPLAESNRSHPQRVLTGYKVWRLTEGQEANQSAWTLITPEEVTGLSAGDDAWANLPNGFYRWAVRAVYTNGVESVPSFSNTLEKYMQTGMIVGLVRRETNAPISGATVSASGVTATTNAAGAYTLIVPVGTHSVTASATGFITQTIDNVAVAFNQSTTVNFVMVVGTDSDDNVLPVTATALNGNYPNPFNPETTISYSIKEAGAVSLEIYNIKGQLVTTLVHQDQSTGHYKAVWSGKDASGRACSSGIYYYRLTAPGYRQVRKMVLSQ